jgi:hypothetical protein
MTIANGRLIRQIGVNIGKRNCVATQAYARESRRSNRFLNVIACVTGSILSSNALIVLSKYITDTYEFKCVTLLISYHFFRTSL